MYPHTQHYGSTPPELRLLLLGNIGCGKTSSADTILSQATDASAATPRSIQLRKDFAEGRVVTLAEAPRWYWNGRQMDESVKKETERAMTLLAPGPHAILLLVPVNQFTEMDGQVPAQLQQVFGKEVLQHTIVLLTCGDYLMGRSVEEYLLKENPGLRQMIGLCGGRHHVINNRQRQDRVQVRELLDKVEDMASTSGAFALKTREERDMEERVQQRKRELMESFRKQTEEKREALASRHASNADTPSNVERPESYRDSWVRRGEVELDAVNGGVADVLRSSPPPSTAAGWQSGRNDDQRESRSFRLNADGARLSQMIEERTSPKVVSTLHHRINSFEENTPEVSPSPSPEPPASVYDPSTPNLAPYPATPAVSSPSSPELRLVLIGRSGAGKSAAGNAILGRDDFESRPESLVAITQECVKKKAAVAGRRVAVVDTPDWFHSERTPDEVRAQISSCVALSAPGPHAFLLCVPTDQPAKTELRALSALESVFGPDVIKKHTLVLFTHADLLRKSGKAGGGGVEAYIAGQRDDLLKLVERCGDRFHVLERDGRGRNVEELLEKVEQIAAEAGGQCYSSPAFLEAENRVREIQAEITRERRRKQQEEEQFRGERRSLYPYMQTVAEAEEEVREEEVERTRAEAERSVSAMNIESLPPIATMAGASPSVFESVVEKVQSNAKMLPKLLSDSSVWVSDGAKKMMSSPVWGSVGSAGKKVQKTAGARAEDLSKIAGDRLPKAVGDSSAWVGTGSREAAAASPLWGKVGSGAKVAANGIGTGAKAVAQSPVWGKVGSGVKSGAKLMADGSVRLGAGLGAGAKKVAQSPVWGQVGSGAKAGAKMVSESSVWQKMLTNAKKVPKVVILGALLGLALGVSLAGAIGGAAGAVVGSALTEVGRRKLAKKNAPEKLASNVDTVDALVKRGEKVMKRE
ncbi:uncharacterized protein LOC133505653 [Syngnathoides biaculeatus]|uniref:uncharacterized protein LOC133505653 n=1 Tax=Syngnathoides biaculeatus TaxID=300417 RepID=UPI002ADD93EE|nr:uncharacterized protein LOC133505653 [Syngnathoides biaculeatus]XP_061684892.1 uncharacterized protein LOC133505653 [Syngnathoides biaculeatus]XP_061684893.1 uncharacterized protein LOC133505653 [Syngnathoides biaculeatus]XP_061684894.1 uncharacterized protein LOC133505653 [Syngnathoides biaculeatus]XP_061684895.1 uncharacterized protein LOC133505653 [Syngnathoides biaculeatus]XP_061684896.1 uncharacterized protein LOC133505653 [Syngnathoides biaculeatus]